MKKKEIFIFQRLSFCVKFILREKAEHPGFQVWNQDELSTKSVTADTFPLKLRKPIPFFNDILEHTFRVFVFLTWKFLILTGYASKQKTEWRDNVRELSEKQLENKEQLFFVNVA